VASETFPQLFMYNLLAYVLGKFDDRDVKKLRVVSSDWLLSAVGPSFLFFFHLGVFGIKMADRNCVT